jgi:PAS domain S-box-containing protein
MTWYRNLPLGTKLNILLSLLLLALFTVIAIFVYTDERTLVHNATVEKARILAREVEGDINRIGVVAEKEPELAFRYFHLFTQFQKVASDREGREAYEVHTVSSRYRNPINKPNPYEAEQLRRFAADPEMNESYALVDGEKEALSFLLPLRANPTCLKCHGRYADAPAGVRKGFPEGHPSFNYRIGEVIGAVSVTIPLAELYKELRTSVAISILYRVAIIPVVVLLVGFLIQRQVVRPVKLLSSTITAVTASGELNRRVPHEGEDEVGRMIGAFNAMIEELDRRALAEKEVEMRCGCVVGSARAAIVAFRSDGGIFMANWQAERLFGLARDELYGRDFYTFIEGGEAIHRRVDFYLMEGAESGPIGEVTVERVRSAAGEAKEAQLAISACKTASVMLIALFWEEEREKGTGDQRSGTRESKPGETRNLKPET